MTPFNNISTISITRGKISFKKLKNFRQTLVKLKRKIWLCVIKKNSQKYQSKKKMNYAKN